MKARREVFLFWVRDCVMGELGEDSQLLDKLLVYWVSVTEVS